MIVFVRLLACPKVMLHVPVLMSHMGTCVCVCVCVCTSHRSQFSIILSLPRFECLHSDRCAVCPGSLTPGLLLCRQPLLNHLWILL